MVTVAQFCDVCMKNLKMTVVGNNPDEDFSRCKCPECDGVDSYPRINGDFSWKIRPMDSKQSREFIVESIETAIRDNNYTFPAAGHTLIEKLVERA